MLQVLFVFRQPYFGVGWTFAELAHFGYNYPLVPK